MVAARGRRLDTKLLMQEVQLRGETIAQLMHSLLGEEKESARDITIDFLSSLSTDALRHALHDDPVWLAFELAGVNIDDWDGDTDSLSKISERALRGERAHRKSGYSDSIAIDP
jgi:hypothetical protein